MTYNSHQNLKRTTVCCPKCGRQTSFAFPGDAIDEEGEFYCCQHSGWPFLTKWLYDTIQAMAHR